MTAVGKNLTWQRTSWPWVKMADKWHFDTCIIPFSEHCKTLAGFGLLVVIWKPWLWFEYQIILDVSSLNSVLESYWLCSASKSFLEHFLVLHLKTYIVTFWVYWAKLFFAMLLFMLKKTFLYVKQSPVKCCLKLKLLALWTCLTL